MSIDSGYHAYGAPPSAHDERSVHDADCAESPPPAEPAAAAASANACSAADRAAGAGLLLEHMQFLQRRCRSYGKTLRIDPDDLFGEVAVRLLAGCPAAQVPRRTLNDMQAWLSTVVRNLSIDLARKARAEQRVRASLRIGDVEFEGSEVMTPLQEAINRDLQRQLQTAFARLNLVDRMVVRRRLWCGDDYEDIYASTSMKPANVRKRLQLSRQQLREALAGCELA